MQDQKILELMLAKREQEHQSHRVREEASLAWEQQRAHEQRARANSEARRRRTLSEQRTARDKLRVWKMENIVELYKYHPYLIPHYKLITVIYDK